MDCVEEINDQGESRLDLNQTCHLGLGMDRYSMFNILVENALKRITSGVSEDQYVDIFGKLAPLSKSKSAPKKMQRKMQTNLMDSLKNEIEIWIQDENLKSKFQTLDNLIDKCALFEGKETWRPNGNVSDHLRSHLMAMKLSHKSVLEEQVGKKEHSVEALKQEVSQLRRQLQSLESRLERIHEQSTNCTVLDNIDAKLSARLKELNLM